MRIVHRVERDIPEPLRWHYEKARSAVFAGVAWDGTTDTVTGLSTGEVMATVGEFLDMFETWLKNPSK